MHAYIGFALKVPFFAIGFWAVGFYIGNNFHRMPGIVHFTDFVFGGTVLRTSKTKRAITKITISSGNPKLPILTPFDSRHTLLGSHGSLTEGPRGPQRIFAQFSSRCSNHITIDMDKGHLEAI